MELKIGKAKTKEQEKTGEKNLEILTGTVLVWVWAECRILVSFFSWPMHTAGPSFSFYLWSTFSIFFSWPEPVQSDAEISPGSLAN